MDSCQSSKPRLITDEFEAVCKHCNQVSYGERVLGTLQPNGAYKYEKLTYGTFVQECDSEGVPIGPVIPKCYCKAGENNA